MQLADPWSHQHAVSSFTTQFEIKITVFKNLQPRSQSSARVLSDFLHVYSTPFSGGDFVSPFHKKMISVPLEWSANNKKNLYDHFWTTDAATAGSVLSGNLTTSEINNYINFNYTSPKVVNRRWMGRILFSTPFSCLESSKSTGEGGLLQRYFKSCFSPNLQSLLLLLMLLPPSRRRHRCILIPHDNDLSQTVEEPAALICSCCCLFVGELEIDKKVNTCSLGIDRCDRPPSYDLFFSVKRSECKCGGVSQQSMESLRRHWWWCSDICDFYFVSFCRKE